MADEDRMQTVAGALEQFGERGCRRQAPTTARPVSDPEPTLPQFETSTGLNEPRRG